MSILIYIEHDGDGITDLSLQCISTGKELAEKNNLKLHCALISADPQNLTADLNKYPIDEINCVTNLELSSYLPGNYASALKSIIDSVTPRLVIIPASTTGNDLAPRTAGLLKVPCVLSCQRIAFENNAPVLHRLEFDAKAIAEYKSRNGGIMLVTVTDGIADPLDQIGDGSAAINQFDWSPDPGLTRSTIVSRDVVRKTVNLKDASVIIGGGAGVGTSDNFALLEQLAEKLGGEIGATRAAVDAGWVRAERQIGQTGVNIKPDLYIACGISGAVQHLVGIREAKTIVAINTDSSAPIFKMAHYKIVGDLCSVIPKLIENLS
jgi:electron transfer flavoprotein alpha subunit